MIDRPAITCRKEAESAFAAAAGSTAVNSAHHDVKMEIVPVLKVPEADFLCTYKTRCPATCLCCDFYACDCQMKCPEGCKCYHDRNFKRHIVDCSLSSHTHIPILLPKDAIEIKLDGNFLGEVDSQSFIGRREVKTLYLNNSQISSLTVQTFRGLNSLEILHLEDNSIGSLVREHFSHLPNLRQLFLQSNELINVDPTSLPSLQVLHLNDNLLTDFPVWKLGSIRPLTELTLSKNTWTCDCEYLEPFANFVRLNMITDKDSLQCTDHNEVQHVVNFSGNMTSVCLSPNATTNSLLNPNDSGSKIQTSVFVSIAVGAIFLMLILFTLAWIFRAKIKLWLYHKSSEIYESRSALSMRSQSSLYNQNKLFDIYISYSARDVDFVHQCLAPAIEHGNSSSYKLCLHQRDFPPSASLYDTVSVATESSERVIIVISKAYLETEWQHVKIPLRNALSGKNANKLIILLVDELSEEDIKSHPELKQYLKSCASVKWGSAGYLNKLDSFYQNQPF